MTSLQPVPEQEWERHKEVLKEMYCAEKLHLQKRKGTGRELSVIELMKERHGFLAR